jgi:hypothetical protein
VGNGLNNGGTCSTPEEARMTTSELYGGQNQTDLGHYFNTKRAICPPRSILNFSISQFLDNRMSVGQLMFAKHDSLHRNVKKKKNANAPRIS